jgi:hypothetical protein
MDGGNHFRYKTDWPHQPHDIVTAPEYEEKIGLYSVLNADI